MNFAIFLPSQAENKKVPVIYYLSGATSTEQNFITKTSCQRYAAKYGLSFVVTDSGPRGCNIEGEEEYNYMGVGVGYYVDATEEKWKRHYRMYSYVTKELPRVINENFPVLTDKQSIMGYSMGGHEALIFFLKNPGMYCSISAFAPLCNPYVSCPIAFVAYLGFNRETWKEYDAVSLFAQYKGPKCEILIDQGDCDEFLLAGRLLPNKLADVATNPCISLKLRYQLGYDHSYHFVNTFLEEHFDFHAQKLFTS